MYSTNNINKQQQERRQAPNFKFDPSGGNFVIHIEDVITDNGRSGLAIYGETIQEAGHETPSSRVSALLMDVITRNPDIIGDVVIDAINLNREGKQ